jgi:hypothetical protein
LTDLLGVAEVATIAVREASESGTVAVAEGEVGSNLIDSSVPQYVPLGAAKHMPLIGSFGCPQATPLANNFIVLRDDVVNLPGRIEQDLELAPVLGQVLCPVDRFESIWQEVVNYVGIKGWEQVGEFSRIAPIEVAEDDFCVLFDD